MCTAPIVESAAPQHSRLGRQSLKSEPLRKKVFSSGIIPNAMRHRCSRTLRFTAHARRGTGGQVRAATLPRTSRQERKTTRAASAQQSLRSSCTGRRERPGRAAATTVRRLYTPPRSHRKPPHALLSAATTWQRSTHKQCARLAALHTPASAPAAAQTILPRVRGVEKCAAAPRTTLQAICTRGEACMLLHAPPPRPTLSTSHTIPHGQGSKYHTPPPTSH